MVTITEISFLRSMACLSLDDGRKVWITRDDLLKSGWQENTSVEKENFASFILHRQYPRALIQAVSLLAGRACSKGEIKRNLIHHRYAENVIELVLYKLEKEKLLDDLEFSRDWVQQRSLKYGSERIKMDLRRKGIPEDIAEEALESLSMENEKAAAVALALKAWARVRPGEDLRRSRQKVVCALVRKGYGWDLAREASDTAEAEVSSED